ncbi:ATPase inhibitor B, mitochondrial-like isoform X1 [Daktulosphaira vitifoliae]|uniref:ATPase inhibitor B, mitochondrial-like isoform X1 n=1 Tax=Daktulosphaira vitifoliae TaxID=58002 RepID=UPI0021A9B7E5|nr:ATPase inhibitor B, mitochondrial-like isoform X1 [Daktulosphaira vitifoliae]
MHNNNFQFDLVLEVNIHTIKISVYIYEMLSRQMMLFCSNSVKNYLIINILNMDSGAGKGGRGGGYIRQLGGKIRERGAALEEEYFRKEREVQLRKLKEELSKKKEKCNAKDDNKKD